MNRARSFVHEWIELVERSGLLVSEPVLHRFFPAGPERVEPRQQRALIGHWERFQVDPNDTQRQSAWLSAVFQFLGWPEERLVQGLRLPATATVHLPELDQTLRPWGALQGDEDRLVLGLWRVPNAQAFDRVERLEGVWRTTPYAKLERWLRKSRTPFGLLTGGSSFRLVHVPSDLPAAWIEFSARDFLDEKSVLDGFSTLLTADRFLGPTERRLLNLAAQSQITQAELTDSLGDQVREAVEALILALDAADRAASGRILNGLDSDEIYKAAVYVVMRLLFILFAEERNLLPHGNVFFDEGYGLGRLLHLLEEEKRIRPEHFEQASDAWPRLLALFRLVFYGTGHPDLTLPAYGGDLFKPAGFPALAALEHAELRFPNRSVYEVLRALTFGEAKVGRERIAQRYSYRNLDVEHIGYLYEGLLDHRAARADKEPLVKLNNDSDAAFRISELEDLAPDKLLSFLAAQKVASGDVDRIKARLEAPADEAQVHLKSLSPAVADRCNRFAGVIRTDKIVEPAHLYITTSASRRSTGTHYTPIRYTRAMVTETLDPLVYVGEHGKLEEPRRLRSPREMLELKICDPAMGSGAFLVQTIRYLGEKLADTWQVERERWGEGVPLYLPFADPVKDREDRIPLPDEREDAELWARRWVAERCVYGVDKNPLAVEMAKLSIWLVTLTDKPFSFVDHALKDGDSLLGITSLDQLRTWSFDTCSPYLGIFEQFIAERVDESLALRQKIQQTAVSIPAHVARKEDLLARANKATHALWVMGDLLVATVLKSKKRAEQDMIRTAILAEITHKLDDSGALSTMADEVLRNQATFHWPLAFPEVFEREVSGFDALVGNPPYMGGQKLTGAFGEPYREYLVGYLAEGMRGSADLVAYFFLRAYNLLCEGGNFGLLAISTIAEGDTRQVGLEQLVRNNGTIYSTHPNEPWPNEAAVVTSRVHVHRGEWTGIKHLLGRQATTISAFLTDREEWTPKRLKANEGIAFQGSIVLGMGFVLSEGEASSILARDPRYQSVVFPYLNGEDLNTHPEQKPSRWVINFWDWSEERAASYTEPYTIVRERVKPERQRKKTDGSYALRKPLPQRWWQHGEKRPALYHKIGRGDHFERHPSDWPGEDKPLHQVIAITLVSKICSFAFVPNNSVFAHRLAIFALDRADNLAILQSSIHQAWAWKNSSRLKFDLNYSPSDCFETFPLPTGSDFEKLIHLGSSYDQLRRELMQRHQFGLTGLFNKLHNPDERSADILRLREIGTEMDYAVATSYGWDALDLQHDFHEVSYLPESDRMRYTISEESRQEILDRLYALNHERYEEEVTQGLHHRQTSKGQEPASNSSRSKQAFMGPYPLPEQPPLFPVDRQTGFQTGFCELFQDQEPHVAKSQRNGYSLEAGRLLSWLQNERDWRSRSEALQAISLSATHWNQAIQELLIAGLIQRVGEKRGTRYRAKDPAE